MERKAISLAEELAEKVYKEFGSPICKPLNRDDADDCRAAKFASGLMKFMAIEPIKDAINEALERAAQEADKEASFWWTCNDNTNCEGQQSADSCAARIRRLKAEG